MKIVAEDKIVDQRIKELVAEWEANKYVSTSSFPPPFATLHFGSSSQAHPREHQSRYRYEHDQHI